MSAKQTGSNGAPGARANGKVVSPALARSVALHLEGKRKEALRELNTAIENGDETAEILAAKGHVQFELEQYEDAIKTYEKLLAIVSRHPTANFNLGICYEKLGRWQEASDAFIKALETDPQRVEANLGLGICLLHQEKPESAIEYFDKVLERQSSHETAMFGKAVDLDNHRRTVVSCFRRAKSRLLRAAAHQQGARQQSTEQEKLITHKS